jgi:hypothetical protein
MVIDVSGDSIAFIFRDQFLVLLDAENEGTRLSLYPSTRHSIQSRRHNAQSKISNIQQPNHNIQSR